MLDKSSYSVSETAKLLDKAPITIRQWIQHDKIKSFKIGGGRRISKEEIEKKLRGE